MKKTLYAFAAAALFAATPALVHAQEVTKVCNDGTSTAAIVRGGCVGHGGLNVHATRKVQKIETHEAKVAAKANTRIARETYRTANGDVVVRHHVALVSHARAGATARCANGLYAHVRDFRAACSSNGGVSAIFRR